MSVGRRRTSAQLDWRERFVRRLIAERRVPFRKIGKFIRFDPHEIEEWIDAQRVPAFDVD
jgi:excisionase family DNA binding protein